MAIVIALIGIVIFGRIFFRFCYDCYEVWIRPVDYLNRTNAWKANWPKVFKNYQPVEADQLRGWTYLSVWVMRIFLPLIIFFIAGIMFAMSMSLFMA